MKLKGAQQKASPINRCQVQSCRFVVVCARCLIPVPVKQYLITVTGS